MDKSSKKKKLFRSNSKYFTISVYTIISFALCLLIFRFTNNWKSTKEQIGEIISVFSPFLLAFLIAYFVNPLVRNIDQFLFKKSLKNHFRRFHLRGEFLSDRIRRQRLRRTLQGPAHR